MKVETNLDLERSALRAAQLTLDSRYSLLHTRRSKAPSPNGPGCRWKRIFRSIAADCWAARACGIVSRRHASNER